jgi:hypothetical protein
MVRHFGAALMPDYSDSDFLGTARHVQLAEEPLEEDSRSWNIREGARKDAVADHIPRMAAESQTGAEQRLGQRRIQSRISWISSPVPPPAVGWV